MANPDTFSNNLMFMEEQAKRANNAVQQSKKLNSANALLFIVLFAKGNTVIYISIDSSLTDFLVMLSPAWREGVTGYPLSRVWRQVVTGFPHSREWRAENRNIYYWLATRFRGYDEYWLCCGGYRLKTGMTGTRITKRVALWYPYPRDISASMHVIKF